MGDNYGTASVGLDYICARTHDNIRPLVVSIICKRHTTTPQTTQPYYIYPNTMPCENLPDVNCTENGIRLTMFAVAVVVMLSLFTLALGLD